MTLLFEVNLGPQSRTVAINDVLAEHPGASGAALGIMCEAWVSGVKLEDLLPRLTDQDLRKLARLANEATAYR